MSRIRFSLALAMGLLVPTLAMAWYWSPPDNVSPQSSGQWTISLAIAKDGMPWAVWGVAPYYSRWNGVAWEPAKPVYPTGDGLLHRWPKMACGLDGSLWVLWEADLRYSWFFGMASRWDGAEWTRPDTLWISNGPSATSYDLAPVSQNEAWFIRGTNSLRQQVEAIHLVDGLTTSYGLGDPILGNERPSIAVDPEGIAWATWLQASPDPLNPRTVIAYSRFVNGAWEPPGSASAPTSMNRYGLVAGVDDTKWIVSHEQDPRFGWLENTYARRWIGTKWSDPQMISDPITGADTTQAQLSVSRNCDGFPTAAWIRGRLTGAEYDVLVTRWDGVRWTRPVVAGRLADSTFAEWPSAAATDTSIWVGYQRGVPPTWAPNVFVTHTIPFQSLEGLALFSAELRPPGARLSWSVPDPLAPNAVRIYRYSGVVALTQGTPPAGSTVIAEFSGSRARKGAFVDHVRTPGTITYWLEVVQVDGGVGWLGPRQVGVPASQSAEMGSRVRLQARLIGGERVEFSAEVPVRTGLQVSINDVQGRLVRVLPIRNDGANPFARVTWDGRGASGQVVSNGIYFARMEVRGGGYSGASKVVWVR